MEKLLLHEDEDKIKRIQNLTTETRRAVQQLIDRVDALGAGPVASMEAFNKLRQWNPAKNLKNILVERAGLLKTTTGVAINTDKMADLLDLPEDEIETLGKALKNYESSPLRNDTHVYIEEGTAKINETSLEAECDLYRFYVDTPEKRQVYNDLQKLAATVNEMADKYDLTHFVNAKLPMLEGGVRREMDGNNPKYTSAAFRPQWQAVAKFSKQINQ